jgi:Tol biopolymer transport system component
MKQVCTPLVLSVFLFAVLSTGAHAQGQCGLSALTDTVGAGFDIPAVSGDLVVFDTGADLVGQNGDGNFEIYAADLSTSPPAITQITHSTGAGIFSDSPTTDGRRIAFESNADLVGENPGGSYQVFVYDLETASLTQLSHGAVDHFDPVIDGDLVAWGSHGDPLGTNADGNSEVFLYDLATSTLRQITHTTSGAAGGVDIDAGRVAFVSSGDVLGNGAGGTYHLYLYDTATASVSELAPTVGGTQSPSIDGHRVAFKASSPAGFDAYVYDLADESLKQITDTSGYNESNPSIQGDFVAFGSQGDPLGTNADHDWEIFLYDLATSTTVQVTDTTGGTEQAFAVLSGTRIVFVTNADPTGTNSDGGMDLFVADCPDLIAPPPPPGPWLTSSEIPDFQFKVRITGQGGTPRMGVEEPVCIPETLCVSGAVPGRSEVFLRIVGPKPNGYLWPTLVKFSTSEVEIWIEQLSSADLHYYELAGAAPGVDELPGLFDRHSFKP